MELGGPSRDVIAPSFGAFPHRVAFKEVKRHRSGTQMKEQTRNTEVKINEEEIGKLPEKEFRIMTVKTTAGSLQSWDRRVRPRLV